MKRASIVFGTNFSIRVKAGLPILIFIFFSFMQRISCLAQGYRIDVALGSNPRESVFMGYYFNGKTYVKDSASVLANGSYTFQGSESLDKGMYFIADGSTLLFDFLVGLDQQFEFQLAEGSFSELKVIGDEENKLFFESIRFNSQRKKEVTPLLTMIKDSTLSKSEKQNAQRKIASINQQVANYQERIILQYPESILATLFKSQRKVVLPSDLVGQQGQDSQRKKLYYYKNHFWDDFDLGDPVLLRLAGTVYKDKVDEYLDQLIVPVQDSLKIAVDYLIEKAKAEQDTYQYLVWHLTTKYQSSKIMGMEEIYVHLVDTYFETGEMDFWANEKLKENLLEKADQYRNSLVGMIAPNLILQGPEGQPKALHDLPNKYTVVYFYDPDCGHCKKETPVLKSFYDATRYDVGIYTVSADTSTSKMKKYIDKMELGKWVNTNGTRTYSISYQKVYDAFTTPTIYLLNGRKEIIAKKIAASQLEEVLENYEKRKRK
ncbi:MAG: DUF5106 domain-containing protein [Bacteroidota bacterium]